MGKELLSLEEMGIPFVSFPELPEVDLGGLAGLEAQAEKIREGAGRAKDWVGVALAQLDQMAGMSREARELTEDKITTTRMGLTEVLGHETLAYRRAAWLGLLEFEFSRELISKAEVKELLGRLVEEGRLIERADGELTAYRKAYAVSSNSAFGEPEVAEVRRVLSGLLSRVFAETGKAWSDKTQELRSQATISCRELADGTSGICVVEVPPKKVQGRWLGGGTLLVESDGQDIKPLGASGSIEGIAGEIRDLGVFLKTYTLVWDKPPVVPGLDPEREKKVHLLWHFLKRAIRAAMLANARAEFAEKATVSPEEFFLERKDGVCLVEFQGVWETPTGEKIPNLFFLVERKEEGEERTLRIVETPDRLKDFFAFCMGEEFSEQGLRFEGVGQPLQAVLRAVFGQTVRSAAKTAGINGK